MAVEGQERLTALDKAADGDAPQVFVEGNMIDHLPRRAGQVEIRPVGRGMKEEDGLRQVAASGQTFQVVFDRGVLRFLLGNGDRSESFFGRNGPGVDVSGDVVTLPIFEEKGSRIHPGIAEDGEIPEFDAAFMNVFPEALGRRLDDRRLFVSRIVVSQDQKDSRVGVAQASAEEKEVFFEHPGDEASIGGRGWSDGGPGLREQIAADEYGRRSLLDDGGEELPIAGDLSMKVGNENARRNANIIKKTGPSRNPRTAMPGA
jgi:hypothetical protein